MIKDDTFENIKNLNNIYVKNVEYFITDKIEKKYYFLSNYPYLNTVIFRKLFRINHFLGNM